MKQMIPPHLALYHQFPISLSCILYHIWDDRWTYVFSRETNVKWNFSICKSTLRTKIQLNSLNFVRLSLGASNVHGISILFVCLWWNRTRIQIATQFTPQTWMKFGIDSSSNSINTLDRRYTYSFFINGYVAFATSFRFFLSLTVCLIRSVSISLRWCLASCAFPNKTILQQPTTFSGN